MDLPDRLAAGSASAATLAADCGAPAEALQRLLRALCTLDVCREGRDGRFTLTDGGEALRRDATAVGPSLRAIVQWWSGPMWSLWPELGYSVRTGLSARLRKTGRTGYAFLDAQPEMAAVFHLVDIGGGNGTLAAAIAGAHPHLHASILDRADAQEAAGLLLRSRDIGSRCRFVVGDFFVDLPAGLDVYLLKSILHNWDDAACARILWSCAQAAAPGAWLLLVERVRPRRLRPRHHDAGLARTDLNMLIGLGGRERTLEEFSALLAAAGFELKAVRSTAFEFSVLEAQRT